MYDKGLIIQLIEQIEEAIRRVEGRSIGLLINGKKLIYGNRFGLMHEN
jgi:hypothetical protein